ncbi:MAG: type II secretion system protein [Gemmatimonadetes bacterium]|nr:type II secretion system protein [Gemmatimonadota bacterium]
MMRARSGMTLLELIVALSILAMMTIAGAVAFGMTIDRQETIREASVDVERAAALRETLRQWILQGDPQVTTGGAPRGGRGGGTGGRQLASVAPGARGTSATTAGVTAAVSTGNELTVVTNGPNPLMAANVRIRIFVDADDDTPEQGLVIEYQASTQTPLLRRELDPSVGDLAIEFYDQRTGRWIPSTEAATGQLIALRIAMIAADGFVLPRLLELPLTIVFGEATP